MKAQQSMMRKVASRGKYFYYYSEYLLMCFLRTFCCCLCSESRPCYRRRMDRLKRHEEACEKLDGEIDIVKLLYVQRVGSFIAKLILKKHQRALVTTFKKYQLANLAEEDTTSSGDSFGKSNPSETALLPSSIQEDGQVSLMAEFNNDPQLTNEQV